jgi:threonine synthase
MPIENIKGRKDSQIHGSTIGVFMNCEVRCSHCGQASQNVLDYKCRKCGHPLEVQVGQDFQAEEISRKIWSIGRYLKFFPYMKDFNRTTLGEGWTPTVKLKEHVYFKLESLNPTGSFKDRGSVALLSALYTRVREAGGYLSEDSSGNAGASMAAYAARAGLTAKIYVPENVSGPKFSQIKFYGATVVRVPGSRQRVAEEAQKPELGKYYVGHILHPLYRDGIRSLAYEIAEQFGWNPPERVYLPVSAGTLILGVISGFEHLAKSDVIERVPRIVACQTEQVSPLYHLFKNSVYRPPRKVTSVADALVSVNPPLLDVMVESLRRVKGDAVMVGEEEILDAWHKLGKEGFFVEPSSAVAYAGYKQHVADEEIPSGESSVIVLTGTGLKSMPERMR